MTTRNTTAKNDITGDAIKTKSANEKYRANYDQIFKKNNSPPNTSSNNK